MMITRTTRPIRAALIGVALIGVTTLTGTAWGQSGGFGRAFHPEVTPRDMVVFHDYLDLADEQRFVIEVLIEEYTEDVRAAVDDMRESMTQSVENVESDNPQRLLDLIMEPINEVRAKREELTEEFYNDVKLQLSDEQLEQWPALERKLLRLSALQSSQLSGEGLDLLDELNRLDLGENIRQSISMFEQDYEMQLDELLRRRENRLGELETQKIRAITSGDGDRARQLIDEELGLRTAIRDHNLEYVDVLASSLPSNAADEFVDNVMSRAYPRVYRQSHVELMFEHARELEDLEESVYEAVAQLHSRYEIELDDINDQIVRAIQQHEPGQLKDRMTRRVDRSAVNRRSTDNPVREKYRERDEMNRQYVNELRNLLTPEQFRELPGSSQALAELRRGPRGQAGGPNRGRRNRDATIRPGSAAEEGSGRSRSRQDDG